MQKKVLLSSLRRNNISADELSTSCQVSAGVLKFKHAGLFILHNPVDMARGDLHLLYLVFSRRGEREREKRSEWLGEECSPYISNEDNIPSSNLFGPITSEPAWRLENDNSTAQKHHLGLATSIW